MRLRSDDQSMVGIATAWLHLPAICRYLMGGITFSLNWRPAVHGNCPWECWPCSGLLIRIALLCMHLEEWMCL